MLAVYSCYPRKKTSIIYEKQGENELNENNENTNHIRNASTQVSSLPTLDISS